MNPFRKFEKAAATFSEETDRFHEANNTFSRVESEFDAFKELSARKLQGAFEICHRMRALPGIDRNYHIFADFHAPRGSIANEFLFVFGEQYSTTAEADSAGRKITKDIEAAALAANIPVKSDIYNNKCGIRIDTKKLTEPEIYPETFLRALAAYSPKVAAFANKAADELQEMREEIIGKLTARGKDGTAAAEQVNVPAKTREKRPG